VSKYDDHDEGHGNSGIYVGRWASVNLASVDWGLLGQRVGLGVLLGLAVGYTAKKALKVLLVIVAVLLLVLLLLQHYSFISINWHIIEEAYTQAFRHPNGIFGSLSGWASQLDMLIPVAGSFVMGFLIGLRLG